MKKIFAMILTIAMVLTLLPATALAAPLPETAGHEHVESVDAELAEVIATSETPMVADVMATSMTLAQVQTLIGAGYTTITVGKDFESTVITEDTTIGLDDTVVTINGALSFRVAAGATLTLKNLVLDGECLSVSSSYSGAALLELVADSWTAKGGPVVMDHVTLQNRQFGTTGPFTNGIYTARVDIAMNDCLFQNLNHSMGGVLWCDKSDVTTTITMTNCTVKDCTGTSKGNNGSLIRFENGSQADITLDGCTFQNLAVSSDGDCGSYAHSAVDVNGGSLTVKDCTFAGCSGVDASAIHVGGTASLTMTGKNKIIGGSTEKGGSDVAVDSTATVNGTPSTNGTVTAGGTPVETVYPYPNDVLASGNCGKNPVESVTWTLYEDGTMEIAGEGEMAGYTEYDSTAKRHVTPWADYIGMITTVDIGEGVTSVGENAFSSEDLTKSLTTVKLPSTLIKIDNAAFNRCNYITNLTLPANLTTINRHAFFGAAITSLNIPASVTTIGYAAFADCKNLTNVVVPETVTSLKGAFWRCTSLVSLTLPSNMTEMPSSMVQGCTKLTSLTIPSGVTSIGENAFKECTSLTSLTIPAGVTTIGPQAFYGCTKLSGLVIPNGVTTIKSQAFYGVKSVKVSSKAVYTLVRNSGYYDYNIICNGPTMTHTAAKAATCTAQGNKDYWTCSICDGVFTSSTHSSSTKTSLTSVTMAATGHSYGADGVCTVCGAGKKVHSFRYVGGEHVTLGVWVQGYGYGPYADKIVTGTGTLANSQELFRDEQNSSGGFAKGMAVFAKADVGYYIPDQGGFRLCMSSVLQSVTQNNMNTYLGHDWTSKRVNGGANSYYTIDQAPKYYTSYYNYGALNSSLSTAKNTYGFTHYFPIVTGSGIYNNKFDEERYVYVQVIAVECDHAGNTSAGTYHEATCSTDAYTDYTCSVCHKAYTVTHEGTKWGHTWVHDPSKGKATGFKCGVCGIQGAAITIEYKGPADIDLAYAYNGSLVEIDTPADAGSSFKIAATIVAEVGELENMALFVKRADNAQYKPLRRGSGGNMWEYYTYITSAGVEDWKGKGQWERLITAKDEPGAGAFESIRAQAELKGYELWKVEDTAKSDCDYGAIIGIEVVPTTCAHDNWSDVMGDTATCQAAGTGTQTCLDCGFVKTVTTSQKKHTKVAIGAAVEATCSATGLTAGSHCSVCGEVLVAQTVVPKKAHTLSATAATAPTCSADGNIAYWTCSVCNKYFSDDKGANEIALESTVVGKIAHAVTATAAKAPTCTEAGNIAYTTCASCGKIFDGDNAVIAIADTVIPAKGHTAAADAAVAPTCTATGLTAGSHCSVCGEVLVAQTEVAANGHTWSAWNGSDTPGGDGYMYASRKCSVCGATEATSWLPMTAPTIPDGFLNGTEELDDEDTPLASMPKLFLDVAWTAWYGAAVKKVADAGLMFGVEDGTHFDPEGKLTRSMAVTTIYRLAGCPDVDDEANPFADVPANRWFTDAVIWAAANGIVNGYDDGNFHPDDYVTREQMAAMMYRYILFTGATGKGKELAYVDSDKVSGWAVEAVRWADAMGGIHSRDGELQPTEYASRADVAFILAIFVDGETEI